MSVWRAFTKFAGDDPLGATLAAWAASAAPLDREAREVIAEDLATLVYADRAVEKLATDGVVDEPTRHAWAAKIATLGEYVLATFVKHAEPMHPALFGALVGAPVGLVGGALGTYVSPKKDKTWRDYAGNMARLGLVGAGSGIIGASVGDALGRAIAPDTTNREILDRATQRAVDATKATLRAAQQPHPQQATMDAAAAELDRWMSNRQ